MTALDLTTPSREEENKKPYLIHILLIVEADISTHLNYILPLYRNNLPLIARIAKLKIIRVHLIVGF